MSRRRVLAVTQVDVQLQKSTPPTLVIIASGSVPSSNWTDPSLEPWRYVLPPEDGIQDFDFVAQPPAESALTVVLPITAEARNVVDVEEYWGPGQPLHGVRVHARADSITTSLAKEPIPPDLPTPAPWRAPTEDADATESLIGKALRAYTTGEPLTFDLRSNRANSERGPGRRISRIWFG